jgi:hypothetical protein
MSIGEDFSGAKWPEQEADTSLPSIAEVNIGGVYLHSHICL